MLFFSWLADALHWFSCSSTMMINCLSASAHDNIPNWAYKYNVGFGHQFSFIQWVIVCEISWKMFAIFGIVFLSIVCFSEQFSLIPSFFSKKTISDRPLLLDEATFSVKNLSAVDDTKLTAVCDLNQFNYWNERAQNNEKMWFCFLEQPELIEKYGYNGEVHLLTTDDGYVLELHRISGGPKSPPRPGKKVVYLQHGLVFSSASFVLSGPDHAISKWHSEMTDEWVPVRKTKFNRFWLNFSFSQGYKLADEGYDVWMGNSRGSLYSMNHTIHESLGCSKNRKGFWAFSLDEIGYYDLPASIDYVLNHTGESKVHYIGHSQGTTAFFIMASERPEYQNKIQTMHAMAPAVFLTHMTSPLMRLATQLTTQIHVSFRTMSNIRFELVKCKKHFFVYSMLESCSHFITCTHGKCIKKFVETSDQCKQFA